MMGWDGILANQMYETGWGWQMEEVKNPTLSRTDSTVKVSASAMESTRMICIAEMQWASALANEGTVGLNMWHS